MMMSIMVDIMISFREFFNSCIFMRFILIDGAVF